MKSRYLLLAWCALPLTAACSSDGSPDPDPGAPDAREVATGDGGDDIDAAPGETGARLSGVVSRSAAPDAAGDGIGNVFVALFDRDPISNMDTAEVVGNALLEDVDLSAAGATVAYTVAGVPPRAEPYFVIAFLDDNGNVDTSDPDAAGPDRGDLVSLNGVSTPQVTLATVGDHAHDIDLNLVMPF